MFKLALMKEKTLIGYFAGAGQKLTEDKDQAKVYPEWNADLYIDSVDLVNKLQEHPGDDVVTIIVVG